MVPPQADVEEIIQKLKRGKAPGGTGLRNEHIKFLTNQHDFAKYLVLLYKELLKKAGAER